MEKKDMPPMRFWAIGIVALLWNIIGVIACITQVYMTQETLKTLPEVDQNFYNNTPTWVTAAFAISVFSGALGAIGLLLENRWAFILFLLSLIGVLTQNTYNFFLQNFIPLSGTRMIMPIITIVVAVFLVWFSRNSISKGWIS